MLTVRTTLSVSPPRAVRYERQVRAFGQRAQTRLADLTVAIVGLGGVGSQVAQSLAHLGVGRLLLIDPDTVTTSNLNRLVGATPADAAEAASKVAVAARTVRSINPDLRVASRHGSVLDPDVWQDLRPAEVIIGAVDGHAPRWALNRLAVQYARCYLDIGVEIGPQPRPVRREMFAEVESHTPAQRGQLEAGGHLAVVRPAGPCLLCLSGYDPRRVATELDQDLRTARRSAGYRVDEPDEPTPSVIFINQILAGHAVAELLNYVQPWRPPFRYVLVDMVTSTTSTVHGERDPDCPACGPGSPRGLADAAGPPEIGSRSTPPPATLAITATEQPTDSSTGIESSGLNPDDLID